ncbi:MAG: LutC/YkgG family protein [Thermodesulfobacteriota bacterium]
MQQSELINRFTEKAQAVQAKVHQVQNMQQALENTVQACSQKQACQVLASGCNLDLSPEAKDLCGLKSWERIMAAPNLDQSSLEILQDLCREKNIALIQQGLHSHLGGIDLGLSLAEFGLAETGSIVQDSGQEDLRLATMISEIHVALLPASRIYQSSFDLEQQMQKIFSRPAAYLAFITGASRTADIERVLTLGVHGPLELQIMILMDS